VIRLLGAISRYQLVVLRRTPDRLLPLATVPLFTAAFLAITQHAGRADLAVNAVLGAALIGIWSSALYVSGDIIEIERAGGTLEGHVAAPAPFTLVVLARIGTVTAVSFLGLAESVLVARVFFGVHTTVHHQALFAVTLACTWAAMASTATIMSGLFVLARSVRTFQNSFSYPFYLLSGAVVPIVLLPGWLQPLSKIVFLSWAADLLRECLSPAPARDAAWQVATVIALAAAGLGAGLWSISAILRRLRWRGTVGYA
jgi:ABC-2 type transport system permease protein